MNDQTRLRKLVRLEVLDDFRHEGRQYTKGDIVSVERSLAAIACDNGWGRDLDGEYKTEAFTPGVRAIQPENVRHDVGDSNG